MKYSKVTFSLVDEGRMPRDQKIPFKGPRFVEQVYGFVFFFYLIVGYSLLLNSFSLIKDFQKTNLFFFSKKEIDER